jgi:hypothetical protein
VEKHGLFNGGLYAFKFVKVLKMNQPFIYERIESGFIFLGSLYIYLHLGFQLLWFIVFLFSIDIFMLGYVVNKTFGAHCYNLGHTYIIPAILIIVGVLGQSHIIIAIAIIWAAHIGWDRALGYGLKFSTGFKNTHLGNL